MIPRTLLTIIKAYIVNYGQTDKKKLPRIDVRFISRKHYHEQIILISKFLAHDNDFPAF